MPRESGYYYFNDPEEDSHRVSIVYFDVPMQEAHFPGGGEYAARQLEGCQWSVNRIELPDVPRSRTLSSSMLEDIATKQAIVDEGEKPRAYNIPKHAMPIRLRNATGKTIEAGMRVTYEARPKQKNMAATVIVPEDHVGLIAASVISVLKNGVGDFYTWHNPKVRR